MSTSGAIGLVLARPPRLLGTEPFFMEFIAGIEQHLADWELSLLLHVVSTQDAELAAYRRWAEHGLVEAAVVVNRLVHDERPAALAALGLPALLVGEPARGFPAVRTDNAGPVRAAVAELLRLGHRRIARITGPGTLLHTAERSAAFVAACEAAGASAQLVEGDYSEEAGAKLTTRLLSGDERPTAILYDNDVMALAGLAAARELGVAVPAELSVVAWDDSALCRLSSPALTAMSVDVHRFGVLVAESVLELLDGDAVAERWSPAAQYVPRGSTGPAAG
ncbi:LacI family DNA-binding transcriptional regulator [Amycolatopsis tolypomycina]|uniref:DNA-binding transcriptional regulator, LacI/PurR family n=1 Tax=Amycolatopsis tolypomycina TaxID=208445 RepID=A0A1H4T7N0_9PSEU|nr:substrate-binding domain-containing protein [Amycolatopsis tolypomycina]SEC52270.1 DNA-binding transcriptional regulator, LacI/PurR family [Amycolatopsis tolypomycina]